MKKGFQIVWLTLIANTAFGQNTINSAGGQATINSKIYEYSIGEVLVHTGRGSSIVVTQGLLQPIKVTPATGAVSSLISDQQLQLFPIPTEDVLNLLGNFEKRGILYIAMYDLTGKLILKKEFNLSSGKELNQINMVGIAKGNYNIKAEFKAYTNASLFNLFQLTKIK